MIYNLFRAGHQVTRRNQVQFRNSTGRVIATLKDPRSPNDANVTLSRNDDLRRFSDELRRISIARNRISQQNVEMNWPKKDDIAPFIEKLKENSASARAINILHKHPSTSSTSKKKKDFTENRFPHFYAHISSQYKTHGQGGLFFIEFFICYYLRN